MRALATVLTLIACVAVHASAQNLTGEYTTTTPTGTFTLNLQQAAGGRVTGTLAGGALNVTVEGQIEAGAAVGILSSAEGQSYFRAEMAGEQVLLTVVDPDAYGQPDYDTAQQFSFSRRAAAAKPSPSPPPPPAPPSGSGSAKLAATEIGDPYWGVTFQAPEGWVHRQTDEGVLMGSNTEKGVILVFPHSYNSLDELRAEAAKGIAEEGAQLVLAGGVEAFGSNGLAAEYQGIADGQQARAYAVGLISPHGGGATILTAVESGAYSAAYAERVRAIARSVRFSPPKTSPAAGGWKEKLAGHCVAYLSSYSSSGPSYDGYSTGGYSSTKSRFYLYPDGTFEGGSSTSISVDTGGAFGNSASDSGNQAGRWQIVGARGGGAALSLRYPDGSTAQYALSTNEKGHTLLDGDRWFVVSYQECNDL